MLKSDFYYDLPEELIAQTPLEPRDSSRLMKIDRASGEIVHDHFYNICDYLKKGDLLVMNDSKVFPARLYGIKQGTGAAVQFLLLHQVSKDRWEVMVKPGKRLKIGTKVDFGAILSILTRSVQPPHLRQDFILPRMYLQSLKKRA